jgi:hypothetical protein
MAVLPQRTRFHTTLALAASLLSAHLLIVCVRTCCWVAAGDRHRSRTDGGVGQREAGEHAEAQATAIQCRTVEEEKLAISTI